MIAGSSVPKGSLDRCAAESRFPARCRVTLLELFGVVWGASLLVVLLSLLASWPERS